MKHTEPVSLDTSGAAPRPRPATPASPLRCLAVWAALTALALVGTVLGGVAVLDTVSSSRTPVSIDQALVTGAGIGATALCPWLWFIATLSVVEALRGQVSVRPGWTRRLTLLACGVAVTTSALAPAHAASDHPAPDRTTQSISLEGPEGPEGLGGLDGLPYPDRASASAGASDRTSARTSTSAEQRAHSQRSGDLPLPVSTPTAAEPDDTPRSTHRVREGDTLWAIAAASTTGADLPRAVAELHLKNRRVIGADPDLIHPGQVLDLHSEGDEPR